MSKKLIQSIYLVVWFVHHDCEVYQDRPKIKTVDGDLVLEPAYDKNIYLRRNGPKSSVFVDGKDILNIKSKINSDGVASNDNLNDIIRAQNDIIQRLVTLEKRTVPVPSDIYFNISSIWRKFDQINRRLITLNGHVSNHGRDQCQSNPCLNGGTCLGLVENFYCICPPNWRGVKCSIDVNECRNFAGTELGCQNGATCINNPGSYECLCRPGWFGLHCTKKIKDCSGGDFEMCGHGTCIPVSNGDGIKCLCDQGWTTNGTDVTCLTDVNECESRYGPRCSTNPRVECVNLPGSFTCGSCPTGYEGDGYTCSDIDECTAFPNGGCSSMVTCHNTIGSRICGSCPPGYQGDGITCSFRGSCNINHGGCHPSAHCIDSIGFGGQTVQCFCPDGMEGDGIGIRGCYISTNNITGSCENNPCGLHGQCHILRSGYTCICHEGYGGSHCDTPTNACTVNPCHNGGICRTDNNLPRGFRCECTAQYSGPLCQIMSKTCGGVLDTEEGSIVYPLSNSSYNHNSRCAWVIHTIPGKVVNVTFSKFNLEANSECLYDFLQIHDGRSSASQLIGRFCGNNYPKGGNIISSNNNLYFWFRSDSTVAKEGFALHWTTIDPVCGGEIDATIHGHISSPGSPGKYPPNRDCNWQLTTSYGKRIQLHFYALDLEIHPNCSFDYLEIYDGMRKSDPLLNKFCNSSQPAPITSAGSNMLIHFHSDAYGSGNGFQIVYAPIEGVPGCGGYFTTDRGELSSPSFNGSALNNLICEYKVKTDAGTKIRIDITKFKLETSFQCQFDFIKIYDGPSAESPLVGRFCGSSYPKSYVTSSNYLFIRFKTDFTIPSEGFKIMYRALCQNLLFGDSGVLKSPGYPISYPHNKECEYIISTTPGKAIQLMFQDFDIEDNRHYRCLYDFVEIRDGPDSNSTLLGKFCGGSDHIPPTQTSTNNYMYIKFNSDMSISGTGFLANYTTIDTECGGIFRKTTGLINHPSDSSDTYKNEQSCSWILIAPEGMHIKLTWNRFELENMPSCNSDYLELIELEDVNNNSSLGKFCGTKAPPALTTSTNRLMISFHSDTSVRASGFSVSYTFLDEKSHCGGTFFKTHGYLYSPGWPNKYETNRDCTWTIMAPIGQQIKINISQFDLERPIQNNCNHGDYLELRNGDSQSAPLIGQYCGKFQSKVIKSLSNSLFMHFHSDYYLTGNGFKLEWQGGLTGCGGTLTGSSGTLSSPNYPQNYNENSECFYKIVTNRGSRLRLSFTDLELERTTNCRDDFVEIFDGRDTDAPSLGKHCYMSPGLNNIETSTNYAFIKFRSDFYNQKQGFLLNYFTLCNTNLTGRHGVIESPDFPNNYPPHTKCLWIINVPKGNKINVTFTHFDIVKYNYYRGWWRHHGSECDHDYLQWKDSSESEFSNKFCGNVIPSIITSKSNSLQIKFVTGDLSSRSGFRLEWINYGCGGLLQKSSGTVSVDAQITSGEIECEWLIETGYGTSINLVVTNLYISNSVNCTTDALEIYNGQNEKSPLLSKVCHNQPVTVIQSTANYMFIKFKKQSMLKGASLTAIYNEQSVSCGAVIQASSGYIYSKNYPKNYDDNLDCVWMISVPSNNRILINFVDLDLYSFNDYPSANDCDDSIRVFDNSISLSSNYTYRICPHSNITQITTKRNRVEIQFITDNFGSAKGFKANFSVTCGEDIVAIYDGIIEKNNYIGGSNSSCIWTITAQKSDQKISLTITHLYLPKTENFVRSNSSCQSSYLRIYDGNDIDAPIIDEYCGLKAPPMIVSRGSALTVKFGSYDHNIVGQFSAHYTPLSAACGGTFTSEEGSIISPNYPRAYPANADCEWILSTSPGNRVYVTFEQFSLEYSERCNEDYLEIRLNNGGGPLLGVYCGNDIPFNTTAAQKLYIKFHSNNENSGGGFLLHYGFLHGNDIVGLDEGEIASPLYPHMYHGTGEYSWRIFTNGTSTITITLDALEIRSHSETCISMLSIYDGYDNTAPLLTEMCGILDTNSKTVQSSSNLIYIVLNTGESNSGALFHMRWTKSEKLNNLDDNKKINCGSNNTMLILPGNSTTITSPNYPEDYSNDLNCEWIFKSAKGRHLSVRFLDFELEEVNKCFADSISISSSDTPGQWKPLIENICEYDKLNQSSTQSLSYMKINFATDSSVTRKGFKAIVKSQCGGTITDLSAVIGPLWNDAQPSYYLNGLNCEWLVKVRPGRVINLQFIFFNITNADSHCKNYVILRNGNSIESPLLGGGKYCGYSHETRNQITTSSNSLHITFVLDTQNNVFQSFKIFYEEKSIECGVTSTLDAEHSWEIISSPNYPSLPLSYSECIWKFSGPPGEILRIDFIDRFDLDDVSDCETEVVEIRDGSSNLAPLKGSFCSEKPGTVKTTGNTMFIKYMTQLSVPRNGFKANISIDTCGGTIIAESGEIFSPGYPHYHVMQPNTVCEWRIIGRPSQVINILPRDMDIPESESPCATKVTIEQPIPKNASFILLKSFCRNDEDPNLNLITTLNNEVVIKFHIQKPGDWSHGAEDRGFRFTFNSSRPSCGGIITSSEGYLTTPGYPIETMIRYCQWTVKVPNKNRRIRLELLDTDTSKHDILIANDLTFFSMIESTSKNNNGLTSNVYETSGPKLAIFVILKPSVSSHKFKASFSSNEKALCGGLLRGLNGSIISPYYDQSLYCEWQYNIPNLDKNDTYKYKSVFVTVQLNSSSTLTRCSLRDPKLSIKVPYSKNRITFSRVLCTNTDVSFRIPSTYFELKLNKDKNDSLFFNFEWKAQPCGGIIDVGNEPINILDIPQSYNDTLDCAWIVRVPYGNRVNIKTDGSFNSECDDEFIKIGRGVSQYTATLGQYCKTKTLDQPLNVNFRTIYIEYHTKKVNNNNIKLFVSNSNEGNTCGSDLYGYKYVFESPHYPKNYDANVECTWTINANVGNRVSLSFLDRFVIEDTVNCTKDALIIYDWNNDDYNEIAKLCGRQIPIPYNSTYNLMKVTFRTDATTNMEGFRAIWKPICGGRYMASEKEQFLYSPGYPSGYSHMLNCSYEIIAPEDKTLLIQFLAFDLEGKQPECAYDNLTVSANTDYKYYFEVYCGDELPSAIHNYNKVSFIFKSDRYVQRKGFKISYKIYDCNMRITEPTMLSSNINNNYEDNMNCTWFIEAPSDKVVVLRFLYVDMETHYECYNDYVAVFEGLLIDDDKRLALLCGHVNSTTMVRAKGSKATLNFVTDASYTFRGFKVQVIFAYSESIGCGGHIDLTSTTTKNLKSFLLNNKAVYENYLDCVWTITSPVDTVIKIEFTSFHISPCRNVNQTALGYSTCDCDLVDIKDGIYPDSLSIGTYCGHTLPPQMSSSGNMMSIRLLTDGEIVSSGFEVKLKAEQSLCGQSHFILSDKAINIKTPGFTTGQIPRGLHCMYYIETSHERNAQLRISFLSLDLQTGSSVKLNKCDKDKLVISEHPSLHNMTYGKDYIMNYYSDSFISSYYEYEDIQLPKQFEICKISSDHYVSGNLAISLVTSPESDSIQHKGVEMEISYASYCGKNLTDTQGKIQYLNLNNYLADIEFSSECNTLITAPENHTISAYFITVTPDYWDTNCYLDIFDGNTTEAPKLVRIIQEYENIYPVFSTGRYMLFHNHRDSEGSVYFDMNFVTTDKGRGCGGKLTNVVGRVTSPMYPDIYRNKSTCEWELETPLGTKVKLHFAVFDLGNSCDQNYLQLVNSNGNVISSYCSEKPADYLSIDNYIKIVFFTTQNNGGTGWVADFYGIL